MQKQNKIEVVDNEKDLVKDIDGKTYCRIPIKTHFVKVNENYIDLVKKYVYPTYLEGDILIGSEKVLALCQGDVIFKDDLQITPLAKFLSKFATKNPAGPAMDNVYKMQTAINLVGRARIITAAFLGAVGKLLGISGLFYKVAGKGVRNIDGFCVVGFDYYSDKGILAPTNPKLACEKVKEQLGIDCVIVDANDINIEILGKNKENAYSNELIKRIIIDNPAGQGVEMTPFIIIRKKDLQKEYDSKSIV
ncbi:F420-0--gamma-glutamyl ligase [Natranaerobius trueperi]|uniref:F420-0--gamma-glutamyl ligase n=1 Tax=Natranaerobius trueperi TaxID=759412 RepID=A0A226BY59_9FIRM|nr:F420-0--gamma-glutamyl ligase [Natranaerobius trueperi]OWZ83946.1 F420-0--gamma-glutamyl ligase [Natranaerobius trueperi]